MGLTFDLANPFAVVSEVVAGGSSHAAGVRIGDHLVRLLLPPPPPVEAWAVKSILVCICTVVDVQSLRANRSNSPLLPASIVAPIGARTSSGVVERG